MPNSFTPLLPARPTAAQPVIPVRAVDSSPKSSAVPIGASPEDRPVTTIPCCQAITPSPPPKITLEREGDCVKRIRIECTCGQIVQLECTY